MRQTLFVPVGYAEVADRIAEMIERGALRIQSHWYSREACQAFIDRQPRGLHASYAPTAVIVRVAEAAGRSAISPPAHSASMIDRRDGGCGFGKHSPGDARHAA